MTQNDGNMTKLKRVEYLLNILEDDLPDIATWQNGAFMGKNQIIDLLGDDPEKLELDKNERKITTNEYTWIDNIYITTRDHDTIKSSMLISVKDPSGKAFKIPESSYTVTSDNSFSKIEVNKFVKEIIFKSVAGKTQRPKIGKIWISGFSLDSFKKTAEKISKAIEINNNILETKQEIIKELELVESSTIEKEQNLLELEDEIGNKTLELNALESDIKQKTEALARVAASTNTIQSKETSLQAKIEQLSEEQKTLSQKIVHSKEEIQELEHNKNIFSDEFIDYVKSSNFHAILYIALSIIPLAVIGSCIWLIYSNARNFLHQGNYELSQVASDFILRLPFSIATISIAFLSWKACEKLIKKCIEIQQSQRELSKILVVAKEVAFSSSHGLLISDETKFKERIRLKVQMISEHLKKEIPQGVEYVPEDDNNLSDLEKEDEESK